MPAQTTLILMFVISTPGPGKVAMMFVFCISSSASKEWSDEAPGTGTVRPGDLIFSKWISMNQALLTHTVYQASRAL